MVCALESGRKRHGAVAFTGDDMSSQHRLGDGWHLTSHINGGCILRNIWSTELSNP
jgi:hypothetical protein